MPPKTPRWFYLLVTWWRGDDEPTRLECWRQLVAAPEPIIRPIARGHR